MLKAPTWTRWVFHSEIRNSISESKIAIGRPNEYKTENEIIKNQHSRQTSFIKQLNGKSVNLGSAETSPELLVQIRFNLADYRSRFFV